jgi:hypothetical protein
MRPTASKVLNFKTLPDIKILTVFHIDCGLSVSANKIPMDFKR